MDSFVNIHRDAIIGSLSTFDRLNFKGYISSLFPAGSLGTFLYRQGVLLKDFKAYVTGVSSAMKAHAQAVATGAGRPYIYLETATTKRQGRSKEEEARRIAERDGIEDGLVCVFGVLEPCGSFTVQPNREARRLQVTRKATKCLHFYFYFLDPEFGFLHVRLQSWFPFNVQVWINGREWLARQLDREGIGYERRDNTFVHIDDVARAQQLCERLTRRKWPRVLNGLVRKLNPMLPILRAAGFGSYYWVADQAEFATDLMFRNRASLEAIYPELVHYVVTTCGAHDVLRFLGRKLHGRFAGEVTTDLKRRTEGVRIKHTLKRNSLKMYDKWHVLRIEVTINNPREFKVLRVVKTRRGRRSRRWLPMGKGVANLYRYAQVSEQAIGRYLEVLAHVQPTGKAIAKLDRLCQPRVVRGTRYASFNPITARDTTLFEAVLDGRHAIAGFRNGDLQNLLYATPARTPADARRRSARTSRLIAKLRGHGLIAKVKNARLYRPTVRGYELMTAAVRYRKQEFPKALKIAA